MELPKFKYHPNPLETDAICESDTTCICCNQQRGYVYIGSVYGRGEYQEQICPWCIHSGDAAKKFDVSFSDPHSLVKAGIDQNIVDEIYKRTPGYTSWQGEDWMSHCDDACAFLGDAKKETLKKLSTEQRNEIFSSTEIDDESWADLLSYYEPGNDPAIYHFECVHCKKQLFNYDCS